MIEMKDTRLQAIGKHASEIERKLKEKYAFTDVDSRTEHHEPDELFSENETIHSFCFILTDMSSDEEIKHTRQLCLEKEEKGGQLQKSVDALGGGLTKYIAQAVYEERKISHSSHL